MKTETKNSELFHPKGSMCLSCINKNKNCSELEFEKMPRMMIYSTAGDSTCYRVVKCSDFIKEDKSNVT